MGSMDAGAAIKDEGGDTLTLRLESQASQAIRSALRQLPAADAHEACAAAISNLTEQLGDRHLAGSKALTRDHPSALLRFPASFSRFIFRFILPLQSPASFSRPPVHPARPPWLVLPPVTRLEAVSLHPYFLPLLGWQSSLHPYILTYFLPCPPWLAVACARRQLVRAFRQRLEEQPAEGQPDEVRLLLGLLHHGLELWHTQRALLGPLHPNCAESLHDVGTAIGALLTNAPQALYAQFGGSCGWDTPALASHAERRALELHTQIAALYDLSQLDCLSESP